MACTVHWFCRIRTTLSSCRTSTFVKRQNVEFFIEVLKKLFNLPLASFICEWRESQFYKIIYFSSDFGFTTPWWPWPGWALYLWPRAGSTELCSRDRSLRSSRFRSTSFRRKLVHTIRQLRMFFVGLDSLKLDSRSRSRLVVTRI